MFDGLVGRRRHQLVHRHRTVTFHEDRCPAAADEEVFELFVADAGQHGRVADLEAVEVQDRQHRGVGHGVQQLVGVPGRGERAGLGLAIADHTGHDQARLSNTAPKAWLSE